MFKYDINSFSEFLNCLRENRVVFIENYIKNHPIPALEGCIITFKSPEGDCKIAVCARDFNVNMSKEDFEYMIMNVKFNDDTQVKVYDYSKDIDIYEQYMENYDSDIEYGLYVLDDIVERCAIVENNN